MNIYSEDILLLKELYEHNTIDVYLLHSKYRLSPAQVARSILKFTNSNILTSTEDNISITEYGLNWIIANRNFIFLKKRDYIWKVIPEQFSQKKLDINDFSIPKRKTLDKRIFKLIEGE